MTNGADAVRRALAEYEVETERRLAEMAKAVLALMEYRDDLEAHLDVAADLLADALHVKDWEAEALIGKGFEVRQKAPA